MESDSKSCYFRFEFGEDQINIAIKIVSSITKKSLLLLK
jgi:hypothetical protein